MRAACCCKLQSGNLIFLTYLIMIVSLTVLLLSWASLSHVPASSRAWLRPRRKLVYWSDVNFWFLIAMSRASHRACIRPSNWSTSSLQNQSRSRLSSLLAHKLLNFKLSELFTAQNACLICTLLPLMKWCSDSPTRRGHSRDATWLGYSNKECRHTVGKIRFGMATSALRGGWQFLSCNYFFLVRVRLRQGKL